MYKFDMHVHTSETSPCGKVKGTEAARLYKDHGYDGFVVTDHYTWRFFKSLGRKKWNEKIDLFLSGYREASREGTKLGLKVFLGIEISFMWNFNDYLVYGLEESFLYHTPRLYNIGIKNFKELAAKKNLLVYQAHPYRLGMKRVKPEWLDGIEVYNGNPRHNSRNELAARLAEGQNLMKISGSDFHRPEDVARGGVIFSEIPQNSRQMVDMLRQGTDLIMK